ncbi:MAG: adenylosuccinate lyase [Deferribacterota bacterium]|nr:adenylosuccinate lyase [Deferribacterota bacterium]
MCKSYKSPFTTRYASQEMIYLFSPYNKFITWRKLWIALAESEKELGLNITDEQIKEMKDNIDNIDFDYAKKMENKFKHDVMAHIYTFAKVAPKAAPIIHLGATSAYVGDNTDIIIIKDAANLILKRLINVIYKLKEFAEEYKDLPTLGFTHLQPAQPTTVGKRAALWLQDFLIDFKEILHFLENLKLRGVKGTTGSQASFLKLFNGDHEKVKALDKLVAQKVGFNKVFTITGQTYTRKIDTMILNILAGIAESAHKFATDLRILQSFGELEEPFETEQIGSSAMAYKRNPMKSERVCSLSRYIITNSLNGNLTHSVQWLERTLDDSANRRVVLAETFLAADSILLILDVITKNIVVNKYIIKKHLDEELPFMATENILMESVNKGANRQKIHQIIRDLSMKAKNNVINGGENTLIEDISSNKEIPLSKDEIIKLLNPSSFIGRSKAQVDEFINTEVNTIVSKYKHLFIGNTQLKV